MFTVLPQAFLAVRIMRELVLLPHCFGRCNGDARSEQIRLQPQLQLRLVVF